MNKNYHGYNTGYTKAYKRLKNKFVYKGSLKIFVTVKTQALLTFALCPSFIMQGVLSVI